MRLEKAIEGFTLYISSDGYSPVTIDNYKRFMSIVARGIGNKELAEITTDDLRKFLTDYREGHAGSSVAQYWKVLRTFWSYAENELHIARPDLPIKQPKYVTRKIIPFSQDEVRRLLSACRSVRNKALVLFLLDTGVRVSECARLTVADANLQTGAVQIIPHLSGRKSRGRIVYISKATRSALWLYLTNSNSTKVLPLFCTKIGTPLDRGDISNILWRLGNSAGIPKCRPHRFRHTFAIEYLRNGGDIFTLQQLLGHSDLSMVKRYLSIAQVDIESAHRRASPVEKWGL